MQIQYHCPNESCTAIICYQPLEDAPPSITCPRCQQNHKLNVTDTMKSQSMVDVCAVCGCKEFFIRKDFPQRVGLAVVVVFGAVGIYFFTIWLVYGLLALTAAVVVDMIIYQFVGRCTVCYACRTEYRDGEFNPAHDNFDLATSEKYLAAES